MGDRKIYDVLIVGAGPVGLATAIALYTRGVHNILVIDQARSFRPVGQVIDILPNGLKSLQYIDPQTYETIKQVGIDFLQNRRAKSEAGKPAPTQKRFWEIKNLQGEVIRSTPLEFEDWLDNYGEGRISIPWHAFQTSLRQSLPSEVVKPNHRCIHLTQQKNTVILECQSDREAIANPYAHWQMQSSTSVVPVESTPAEAEIVSTTFETRMVVAADGINSTLKQILYQNSPLQSWAQPEYSGFGAIGCLQMQNVPSSMIQALEEQYFRGQSVVTLQNSAVGSPRLILIRRSETSLGYLLHAPVVLDRLQNQTADALIQLATDLLTEAAFPSLLIQVIQCSDPEGLLKRPYYIHPTHLDYPEPLWSRDRIVLVGDAAHGMPPFAAQGANQGLEDAAIVGTAIAKLIQEKALDNLPRITQQFQSYEQLRRPFMGRVQTATLQNPAWSQEEWLRFSDEVYSRDIEALVSRCVAG